MRRRARGGARFPRLRGAASGDPDGPALAGADPSLRHDFGAEPWALPEEVVGPGAPWHVRGSLLGLERALAGLSLHGLAGDALPEAPPVLDAVQRRGLAVPAVLANPRELTDADRDAIAAAIEAGRARAAALRPGEAAVAAACREAGLDPWRAQAFEWLLEHEPDARESFFSLGELLYLGAPGERRFDAWGVSDDLAAGLVPRMPGPVPLDETAGRPPQPALAERFVDLELARGGPPRRAAAAGEPPALGRRRRSCRTSSPRPDPWRPTTGWASTRGCARRSPSGSTTRWRRSWGAGRCNRRRRPGGRGEGSGPGARRAPGAPRRRGLRGARAARALAEDRGAGARPLRERPRHAAGADRARGPAGAAARLRGGRPPRLRARGAAVGVRLGRGHGRRRPQHPRGGGAHGRLAPRGQRADRGRGLRARRGRRGRPGGGHGERREGAARQGARPRTPSGSSRTAGSRRSLTSSGPTRSASWWWRWT